MSVVKLFFSGPVINLAFDLYSGRVLREVKIICELSRSIYCHVEEYCSRYIL